MYVCVCVCMCVCVCVCVCLDVTVAVCLQLSIYECIWEKEHSDKSGWHVALEKQRHQNKFIIPQT